MGIQDHAILSRFLFKNKTTRMRKRKKFNKDDMIRFLCWWNMKYPGMAGMCHYPTHSDIDEWINVESNPGKIKQVLLAVSGLVNSSKEERILFDGYDKYEIQNFIGG